MKEHHLHPAVHWAGFDVAKASFVAAQWGHHDLPQMRIRLFFRSPEGAEEVLVWLREAAPEGAALGVVMEATGTFAEALAGWLLDRDPTLHIAIVNPAQTSAFMRSLGLRNKTDGLDAKALARFGHDRRPMAWVKASPDMSALKDLVRTRMDLVGTRTAMNLRLKDHDRTSNAATTALQKVIRTLDQQVEALTLDPRQRMRWRGKQPEKHWLFCNGS